MKIRRLIAFAISAVLLAGVVSANAAQPIQIDRSTKPTEPSFGFSIYDDNFSGYGAYSSISGAKRGGFTTNVECTSVSDPKCAEADNLRVSVIVPPCPANYDATDVCIKSLRTADSTGTLQNATLQYEADTNKFVKDTVNQLPAGGGGSVWRGANVKGGTLDYAVVVDLQINWFRTPQPGLANSQKSVVGYSAQVIPVKIKSGSKSLELVNASEPKLQNEIDLASDREIAVVRIPTIAEIVAENASPIITKLSGETLRSRVAKRNVRRVASNAPIAATTMAAIEPITTTFARTPITTASAAPAEVPKIAGSANGLLVAPCASVPATPRAAPTIRAVIMRGIRICQSISAALVFAPGLNSAVTKPSI